ncbi:MAG: PDZ domain-containing protein [Bryobacteraceae bacterium]
MDVPVFEPRNDIQRLSELGDPKKDLIQRLGIVGVTITPAVMELLGELRIPTGVLVSSIVANRLAVDSRLQEGDVVHSINRAQITSVEGLRAAFDQLQPGDPVAMQVERNARLTYVTFEVE